MAFRRIPSLNWLRVFEAAARTQSFARAAEALNMSAPAVSQQIRALETALGHALFERGPQSVRLTDAGRAFLPAVARALGEVEVAATSLFGTPGVAPVVLRCSAMLAVSWLAPRLPAFEAAHPEVRLVLGTAVNDEDFARRGPDLQITFGMPPGPGEEADVLFGERLYPVARPEVAAAIRQPADLLAHRLIDVMTHRANWPMVLAETGLAGTGAADRAPDTVYTDTTLVAFAMAAAGGEIALARAPASDGIEQLNGLVPCLPGFSTPGLQHYALVRPARARLTRPASAFRDWLLAEAAAERNGE